MFLVTVAQKLKLVLLPSREHHRSFCVRERIPVIKTHLHSLGPIPHNRICILLTCLRQLSYHTSVQQAKIQTDIYIISIHFSLFGIALTVVFLHYPKLSLTCSRDQVQGMRRIHQECPICYNTPTLHCWQIHALHHNTSPQSTSTQVHLTAWGKRPTSA